MEESDQLARVLSTESPLTKVSTNSSPRDHTEPSLKTESERDAETLEFSTPTGSVKMEHTNSTKSSLLIQSTRLLEEIPESTGLPETNTSTEKAEVSHPLERDTEDSDTEVPEIITEDPAESKAGSEEIKSPSEDTDELECTNTYFLTLAYK